MSLADKMKHYKAPIKRTGPLWLGPESSEDQGGITQSLLQGFLQCRERFRIKVIEGIGPAEGFSRYLFYGNAWHAAEEAHTRTPLNPLLWKKAIMDEGRKELAANPTASEQIEHWTAVCLTQFPIYLKYWSKHPDVTQRIPLLSEQVFNVPYKLPSGRTVYLKGKWDSVDLVNKECRCGGGAKEGHEMDCSIFKKEVWLMENKTKGEINEAQLKRQLSFDLQTMFYLIALSAPEGLASFATNGVHPIAGVRYNVIRRPLSGGKGSIVRHKATKNQPEETKDHFYKRLSGIIEESAQDFFFRWNVGITAGDIEIFRKTCLDPILENLCRWYAWIISKEVRDKGLYHDGAGWGEHWRHPFGVRNVLDDGGMSDLDEYLASGSMTGLKQITNLFPEL